MKPERRFGAFAALCAGSLFLSSGLWAQTVQSRPTGAVDDWTTHSIVFTRDGLAQHPELLDQEPRVRWQMMQHVAEARAHVEPQVGLGTNIVSNGATQRDWNVALGKGRVSANQYPSKFTFNPGAPPSCSSDYVVFGLGTAGAANGQANLVAFNNLYSNPTGTGFCTTDGPSVMFAYDITTGTGGKIVTSPVISLDGTKIAFVESLAASSVFHVLTWTSGQGGITTAEKPAAGAMTSLTFSTTATTTSSAPWVWYGPDIAFVGDDSGVMHKITGVFHGTPTEVKTSPWPITVASGVKLSPATLDQGRGLLMAGGNNGSLYQINVNNGNVFTLDLIGKSGTNPGILAAPVVDITYGTTFVVSANNGSNAILAQVNTNNQLILDGAANIGLGASGGADITIYQPAFNNAYWNSAAGAAIYTCGTGTTTTSPYAYSFGFTNGLMNAATPAGSLQLLTSTAATCTGWTEFYNPNVNGGTDFFFFGLTQDCTGTGTANGCVASLVGTTLTPATVNGGTSGIVVDNYSTDAQASSIYLTAEKANTAYKFTQNGLQ